MAKHIRSMCPSCDQAIHFIRTNEFLTETVDGQNLFLFIIHLLICCIFFFFTGLLLFDVDILQINR